MTKSLAYLFRLLIEGGGKTVTRAPSSYPSILDTKELTVLTNGIQEKEKEA